jgi:uncharacterized protein (DUF2236 family)
MLIIKTAEYSCGGLTEAEKRQLFDEHVQWYRMYVSRRARDQSGHVGHLLDPHSEALDRLMPTPVWDQMFTPLVTGQRWIAAGLFDPAVREKAGMRWTPSDEVVLRLFGRLVEMAFVVVPDEIRLHPRALAAYKRAAGRLPADAPLAQAPSFTAPPRDWRDMPVHYVPMRQVTGRARRIVGVHHLLPGRSAAGVRSQKPGKAA